MQTEGGVQGVSFAFCILHSAFQAAPSSMSRPAVFLDRDGTMLEEHGYLVSLDRVRVFPWTADALRLLRRAGFATVVISNQSAVARGLVDEDFVHDAHKFLDGILARAGGGIDRYYFCPHLPDASVPKYRRSCECRKPGGALVQQACREMDLDPLRSTMVGDRWLDVACGRAAGVRTVLLRSGHGPHDHEPLPEGVHPDVVLGNLMEAAGWILRTSSR
jgi:D-glycero-D-manno-heptose 1,7-bisphosphate phosphatase